MHRLVTLCGAALLLVSAGCGDKGAKGTASGVSKSEFRALETRVAALEKKGPAAAATADPEVKEKLAALEARLAKLAKLAAGGGRTASASGPLAIGLPNDKKNVWKCVKVAKGPTVDGKLDDAAWKSAVQVQLVSDENPPKRIANDTVVLICHDTENFYIAALCMESEMDKLYITGTKRDDKIYRDDCVEFYIDQENDKNDAVKLVVNPDGVFMDFLRGTSGDAGDVTWNVTVKTAKLEDRFIMEIAIPLKDMKVEYAPGKTIGFNPYRMRTKKGGKLGEYTTWWGQCNKVDSLGKVTLE